MKSFILVILMSTALFSLASANAGSRCHPIHGNWINAATTNCHGEFPGASNGGGPEVDSAPLPVIRECKWEKQT